MINHDPRQLPTATRLHWYEIRSVLGQGGFGITYLAIDTNLHHEVAIKEYFPMGIATRDDGLTVVANPVEQSDYDYGLNRFLDEGRTLVRFDHPALVRVTSVFEANGTAYLVMRYEKGRPLSAMLDDRGTLDESELRGIALALIDGLAQVHDAGFIHRDIKPANIYIREDGLPVLLDFGSARQALGTHTQTLTTMVSAGYAPYEQYMSAAEHQGPWTDVYSIGATLYRAASGTAPMAALDRGKAIMNDLGDYLTPLGDIVDTGYSKQFVATVMHALAFKESDRPQSLLALRDELTGESTAMMALDQKDASSGDSDGEAPTEVWQPTEQQTATAVVVELERKTRPLIRYLLIAMVVFGTAIAGGFLFAKWPTIGSDRLLVPELANEQPAPAPEVIENEHVIAELLAAAGEDLAALRLTTPARNNAYDKYRDVLASDPSNEDAKKGIQRIAVRYLELARDAAKQQRWELMFEYLRKARMVAPANAKIQAAERRLRSMVDRKARGR